MSRTYPYRESGKHMSATNDRRNMIVWAAAAATLALSGAAIAAVGDFDGDVASLTQTRAWTNAINWDTDVLPINGVSPITFGTDGDGSLTLGAGTWIHPSLTFNDWVTYDLSTGVFATTGGGAINMNASVGATYGSEYFADGNTHWGVLRLDVPTTINFLKPSSGSLRIAGNIGGLGALTINGGFNMSHNVYFTQPSAAYVQPVLIQNGGGARLLDGGRTGTGVITMQQGRFDILSDLNQVVANAIDVAYGMIRADHNYTANPMVGFAPGMVQSLGPVRVDNPMLVGGNNDATVMFTTDNGFDLQLESLTLDNLGLLVPAGLRNVAASNGNRYGGYAGSVLQTGPNRLNELVVTTQVGVKGTGASYYKDLDPAAPVITGLDLQKRGTGVLAIAGNSIATSLGIKYVHEGVLRYENPSSAGGVRTTILQGALGPVSSAMGVEWNTPLPLPWQLTTGAIAGQSGAWDIDLMGHAAAINLNVVNTAGAATGMRLGSSGTGQTGGVITPYANPAGSQWYLLGGGGGTLQLITPLVSVPAPAATNIEMGTTGQLLPGRVELLSPINIMPGMTFIRAGTLQALPPGLLAGSAGTSLGCYSTQLTTGSAYAGAGMVANPTLGFWDGPGQLLLSGVAHNAGGYNYFPGGAFGGGGLMLDGGAIGWDTPVNLNAVPGIYGATVVSLLNLSVALPGVVMPTNILHLGGEYSSGAMAVNFPITDNPNAPVALLKSGWNSILDMTPATMMGFFPTYTGGTGIMGGEVLIMNGSDLGKAPITITDGGRLHVVAGAMMVPQIDQLVRVANGVQQRASVIEVDAGAQPVMMTGITSPTGAALEADVIGSVLQKTGGGMLAINAPPVPAVMGTPANTWGIRATGGIVWLNHLPGIFTPSNGQALFDGGQMDVATAPGMLPPAILYHPNYGFGALSSYAGTVSQLMVQPSTLFRLTGGQRGDWMGTVNVQMAPDAVFKVAADAAGDDTRGTGTMDFSGGNVQFTPNPAAPGRILIPRDAGFTLSLNNTVLFSGCPDADLNGNLLFNQTSGSTQVSIDGATVDNIPLSYPDTWSIRGTGLTSWNGLVIKSQTEPVPLGGGPFTTGTVNFDRNKGAPVIVASGSVLRVDFGVVNAGNRGDPFTDTATPTLHVDVENNSAGFAAPAHGFNVTAGTKRVGMLTVTGFNPAAPALGTSSSSAYSGAAIEADHIRQRDFNLYGTGVATVRLSGGNSGTSRVEQLNIAGGMGAWTGKLDLTDNDLIYDYTGPTPLATVFNQIKQGYFSGTWTGAGITSSRAATSPNAGEAGKTGLGYGENSVLGFVTFDAQAADNTALIIKYTYLGDTNLDGQVTIADLGNLASNWQSTAAVWTDGDFNYDNAVTISDLGDLASNWQAGVGSPLGMSFAEALAAVGLGEAQVPEAGSVVMIGIASASLLLRRRRRAGVVL